MMRPTSSLGALGALGALGTLGGGQGEFVVVNDQQGNGGN